MSTGGYDLDALYPLYQAYVGALWSRTGRRPQLLERIEFDSWFKGISEDSQARCVFGWTRAAKGGMEAAAQSTSAPLPQES